MVMTPAELAALPTAPTVSDALEEAARYVTDGPILALTKAAYGSSDPNNYAAIVPSEHVIAWGVALISTARRIDPAISAEWPDSSWEASRFSTTVGDAHRALTEWAQEHTADELADLFRTSAHAARFVEK